MSTSRQRLMLFERANIRRILAGSLLLAATAWAAPPAQAQGSRTDVINTDLGVNGRHLRDAIALGRTALASLEGPRATEELADTHKTMDLMYRTVRLALFGMRERKKAGKFDDPMLDYELGRTGKAWDIIRRPVDSYFNSLPPQVYIDNAIRDLQEAIQILQPVAAVME